MPEERKLVTILFADVTGSTALGESLDPEDVRALMGRYYEHAREIIAGHGGTIEKFIGDAVMAVFGLTQAHGDDAERALAAAMALRKAVTDDEVLGPVFQLRIGVNTGEVVATTDLSRGDFLITGDAVNVAARLQQHCTPGEIIASERTANAAQTAFVFDEPRMIEVKGKRLPLRVFPLEGVQSVRKVFRPPFVGRKQDMMQLELLKERVLEEERPQLVSIVAPAGTGKTRLLEEFLKRIDADDGFEVAMVRCLPYGQTLTYWPLHGLLEGLLIGKEITKIHIQSIFTSGGFKIEDAARLADLVLSTLGIEGETTGAGDRESIFSAWRLLIEAFAQQAPRILIFEDLHWASDSMLDLVEHVISMRTHARLLLIILSRPELLDRRPTWGGGHQNFTALALQPLSAKLTQDLIKQLTTDFPAEVRQQIVERSGGNPFFALELVRGLNERGITGENVTVDVLPDTVHAAVLARLDLLSKQERAFLQVASVASRAIRREMIHAVLENFSEQDINIAIDGLVERDMLVPSEDSMLAFRHILIRDVAYGILSRAERVRLHAKIAAWLEISAGDQVDQYAEVIAYHYREAVQLAKQAAVPKPMPTETAKAVQYLERAGELASHAGAFVEAETYLKNALSFAPQSEHLRLYEKLGTSLGWGDTALDAYRKALVLWRTSDEQEPVTGARLMRKLMDAYVDSRYNNNPEPEEMAQLRTEALQLAELAGDEDEMWRVRAYSLVQILIQRSTTPEEVAYGIKMGNEAIAYFEQRNDSEALDYALNTMALYCWITGDHTEAIRVSKRRLSIQNLPTDSRGNAWNHIVISYFLLGEYAQCLTAYYEALGDIGPEEPLEYHAESINTAMLAAYFTGRWSEIDPLLEALAQVWERIQQRSGTGIIVHTGYMIALDLAVAREDRPLMDIASSVIERVHPNSTTIKGFLRATRDGDLDALNLESLAPDTMGPFLMMFSEAGRIAPQELLVHSFFQDDMTVWCNKIARALANGDNVQLSLAIDEAEAHHLIIHAARMRVVLAQCTGDRSQLTRARKVLESAGDIHYLRKLEEVEAVLA